VIGDVHGEVAQSMGSAQHHVVLGADGEQAENAETTERHDVASELWVNALIGELGRDGELLIWMSTQVRLELRSTIAWLKKWKD
jgi:hypothetical protein